MKNNIKNKLNINKNIKFRITLCTILLVGILGIMATYAYAQISKIDRFSDDYKDNLIRFHVLANSDSDEDQNLKLKVRDEVISYLQPKLKDSKSIQESEKIILNEEDKLMDICKETIKENGYDYDVSINLGYSKFPTKQYSSVVLPAGEYKALKIVIGKGQGRNWWCVMFPSLCFVDESKNSVDSSSLEHEIENIEPKNDNITNEDKEKNNESNNVNGGVKVRFKIVETIENIFD